MVVMTRRARSPVFGSAAVLVGITSVAAQIVVPSPRTSPTSTAGRVVGTVMSGLLVGILISRTVAGLVAQAASWRAVFVLGAVLSVAVAVLLWRELPKLAPERRMTYPTLLGLGAAPGPRGAGAADADGLRRRGVRLVQRVLDQRWLPAGRTYHWNDAAIGAFALVGAAGAIAARFAGKFADRGHARVATGAFVGVAALSYVLIALGGHSIVALIIGVVLLDLGAQGTQISSQSMIYKLRSDARSRLNTAYMTAYFVVGAIGSGLSAWAYSTGGWSAVCWLGAAFLVLGMLIWVAEMFFGRRGSVEEAVEPEPVASVTPAR